MKLGFWLQTAYLDRKDIVYEMERFAGAGFTYVNVLTFTRGALYASNLVRTSDLYTFDVLDVAVEIAHDLGLEVYAWQYMGAEAPYYVGAADDWNLANVVDSPAWSNWSLEEVRQRAADVAADILSRYDVHLHLDACRSLDLQTWSEAGEVLQTEHVSDVLR